LILPEFISLTEQKYKSSIPLKLKSTRQSMHF